MLEPVSTPLTVTDARLEVSETLLLGRSYRLSGDDREALRYALQALEYKRAAGDHSGEASALNALGLVYHGLGDDAQALAYYPRVWRSVKPWKTAGASWRCSSTSARCI